MFDPQMELLSNQLEQVVERLKSGADDQSAWALAQRCYKAAKDEDEDLELAIEMQDLESLQEILDAWLSGSRLRTVHDRDVLKRAMKAYRKSLKVTRLDAESSIGGGPMSSGQNSTISGIRPPERYPPAIWAELARQGRLIDAGHGLFELPPE